jgi:hypothetical protein
MITNLETRAMMDCCRRKVRSAVVPAIFAVLLLAAPFCRGQNSNTGEIKGLITDATGSVVPGATVRISNVQTGLTTTTTTNQDGLYDAPSLELGEYSISFSLAGFRDYVRNGVVLQLTTIAINGVLEVGTATEKVIVTEAVPLLETEQSDQSLSIDAVAVQNAPIVGGDWRNELTNVIPGVNGGGGQSASGQSFGVNGTQGYMGNWLLEGAIATDPRDNNSSNNFPPVDAIGQVKINSSNYGAQYGNGVNAVNVILKSGANRWHGSAFEFIQNNAFNAKNYFQRGASAPLRWNEFGGSVGGAIIRDKLFFYFTYQRNPSTTSVVSILTVPTQAIRNGDFSALPATIYNPNTTVCAGPGNTNCSRTPFAGNTIPNGQIDPVAAAIQGYLPLPNLPGNVNNYSAVATTPGLNQWYVGKVDYNVSDANRISGSVLGFPTANTSGADAFCALGFDCTKSTTLNVAGQMGNTVHFFNWDSKRGTLTEMQSISTLPEDFHGVSTSAEIKVSPGGRFLYTSNRGHNSIAVFSIDPKSGHLTPIQDIPSGGEWPRNFEFDPTGNWMIVTNHNSYNVAVFRIDQVTGRLTAVGKPVEVPFPPFSPRFLTPSPKG